MIYLNGLSIEWTKILISVDNIDTFIIITNLPKSGLDLIDNDKEIYLASGLNDIVIHRGADIRISDFYVHV